MALNATDTYLSLFLSRPWLSVLELFLLSLGRITPIVAIVPFFGARVLSNPMKVGFSLALVPIFLPILFAQSTGPLHFDFFFIVLVLKEILLGYILAFILSMPFYFASAAGILIDHQSGSQSLQVMDPSSQVQSSPTGILYGNMVLVIFFMIGGYFLFLEAFYTSYLIIPAEHFLNPAFFNLEAPVWHTLLHFFTTLFTIALQLAAPSLITILMSDLFLGIANRMAPQVQISFLMWSLKSFFGLAVLWAGWWFILKQMDVRTLSWLKSLQHIVEQTPN